MLLYYIPQNTLYAIMIRNWPRHVIQNCYFNYFQWRNEQHRLCKASNKSSHKTRAKQDISFIIFKMVIHILIYCKPKNYYFIYS